MLLYKKKSVLNHHLTLTMFYLNLPWPAMVYEICTIKFSFDLRWFHGTSMSVFSGVIDSTVVK